MTIESCYAKLSYLLGKKYSTEKIKKMMMTPLRGELIDIKKGEEKFSLKNSKLIKAIAKVMNSQEAEDYKEISAMIDPVLANSVANTGDLDLMI